MRSNAKANANAATTEVATKTTLNQLASTEALTVAAIWGWCGLNAARTADAAAEAATEEEATATA